MKKYKINNINRNLRNKILKKKIKLMKKICIADNCKKKFTLFQSYIMGMTNKRLFNKNKTSREIQRVKKLLFSKKYFF
jgi:ribosomal protein S20